jgi:hypothetical protein
VPYMVKFPTLLTQGTGHFRVKGLSLYLLGLWIIVLSLYEDISFYEMPFVNISKHR